jgi:hypothetical protein
VIDPKI